MIVIATVYEYDYKATVVYIRHMNIITSVWLLLPCPWPFNVFAVVKSYFSKSRLYTKVKVTIVGPC